MKVLLRWLQEFVPYEGSASDAAELLERLGFEVAAVDDFSSNVSGIVTAEVREATRHPNADRLSLCRVWDGSQEFSVVCGAPNVKTGQRVAFARLGARLPRGLEIRAAKIRGVESQGMICSASELGLEAHSDGILELPESTAPGQDARHVLGLDDARLELEVTPNRRDALSILGVARELSAGTGLPLKWPEPRVRELDMTQPISVVNEATDLCPRYTARLMREIRVGPSPDWMARRLTHCGIRPINNLVDITNYVLLELGQPLHAFDAVKMKGRHVRIRRSRAGESIHLLDGRTVALPEGTCVIADEARPAALAGIMGGEETCITANTEEIILESAAFAPAAIRLASKAVQTQSESSYRFERGSDWAMVALASRRAAQLIQDHCGGLGFKPVEASGPAPAQVTVKLQTERIRTFLGIDLKDSVAADYLRRLGCIINTGTGQHAVSVPSWRLDLTQEADLMEEIARLHGYDKIPQRSPAIQSTQVPEDPGWVFERRMARLLCGLGFMESCSTSFLSRAAVAPWAAGFGQPTDARPIAMANPLSAEQEVLRTSLVPGLFANAALNFSRQQPGVSLFECGRVFFENMDGRHERKRLALLLAGQQHTPTWRTSSRPADFHDLIGVLESIVHTLHVPNVHTAHHRNPGFHPRRSAVLFSGGISLAWFGELHPDLAEQAGLKHAVLAAEFNLPAIQESLPNQISTIVPSAFPPVHRDLSITLERHIPHERVHKTIRAAAGATLDRLFLIDVYQGDKIGAGRKSMTYSLEFRHPEKTLTDIDVEKVMSRIIIELDKKCGAILRK